MRLLGTPKREKVLIWAWGFPPWKEITVYSNIRIDSPREFVIGERVESILPMNADFEFFGCVAVARHGTVTEFKIEKFEI